MKKVWLQKLLATNQFIIEESQNKVTTNKSWFTVVWREKSIYSRGREGQTLIDWWLTLQGEEGDSLL
jgi:hypothetical protein